MTVKRLPLKPLSHTADPLDSAVRALAHLLGQQVAREAHSASMHEDQDYDEDQIRRD